MTAQELAYTEIERLVANFKNMPASQRRGMNEMQTRLGYILPLFKALGWDTSNINEVSPEEKVSRGWVDFSFRIGNVPRFFLETLVYAFRQGDIQGIVRGVLGQGVAEEKVLSAVRSALRSLLTDEGGKPPTVFLSYSHEDKKIVSKVAELLRAEGIDVWIDLSGIHWGDNIAERVQRGLDSADFVAFFMSRNSLGKVWPQAELNAIISRELSSNRGPIVLPIRLDDVEIPPLLRSIKYLELRDHNVNRATKELIDTIRHHMVGRGYKDLKR